MSCQIVVMTGPARSGKTTRLLADYRRQLAGGGIGTAIWLAPNHRAAAAVSERLLDDSLPGCLAPNLLTFNHFSHRVLAAAARRLRPISALQSRTLLRGLIDEAAGAGRLKYFRPIAHTPGFLDLVSGLIRELKRLEIWPDELLSAQGPRPLAKDRELCHLYAGYQELLNQYELYDAQGQFWSARHLLREGNWQAFSALKHVYVDGFADFTRTEHEILELLAARVDTLHLTLLVDEGRDELFAKTRATLAELQRRHAQLKVEPLPHPLPTVTQLQPALAHLEQTLFGNPRQATPLADARGIEIVAAAGTTHEIELLAHRIKRMLLGTADAPPAPAAEILVVFRSLAEVAPLVGEIFTRFGIPHTVDAAPRLDTSPLIAALIRWLRLDVEDWPFRELLDALVHNYFQPDWPQYSARQAAALEWLVQDLQIPTGRDALQGAIDWLYERSESKLAAKHRLTARELAARSALPLVRRLGEAFDNLPRQATCAQWAAALALLARQFGALRAVEQHPLGEEAAARDVSAWGQLQSALLEADRLYTWIGRPAELLDRRQFLERLVDLAHNQQLSLARDETGCVRVLSAEAARGLAVPHVFLAGLSERGFPAPQRDDCVLSDADARRWSERGLPVPSGELRGQFEMLLFYETVTRASRQLVFSYPALDASAQPLVPSPYLSEIEQACGAGVIPRNSQPHLDSVPASDDVLCARDFRVRAVHQALAGQPRLFEEFSTHPPTRRVARNVLHGLAVTDSRLRVPSLGAYDGLFSESAQATLAEHFGPQRKWSPSQLETYAYCPFRFLMQRLLRIKPLGNPELAVDHLQRGQLLHWALSYVHRTLNQSVGREVAPGPETIDTFARLVVDALTELRGQSQHDALASGLREIDVRVIAANLEKYLQQHALYSQHWQQWESPLVPKHFEVAFGLQAVAGEDDDALPDDLDPLSRDEPFELDCAGEVLSFHGRIDRIDVGTVAGQTVFSVVDYKSGAGTHRANLKEVLAGRSFQLPLYAMAAEQLLEASGAVPLLAAYWHLGGKGYSDSQAVKCHVVNEGTLAPDELWQELLQSLRQRLRALIEGIRRGRFPMHSVDEHCTGQCEFNTVCRVNQARSVDKQWETPRSEP